MASACHQSLVTEKELSKPQRNGGTKGPGPSLLGWLAGWLGCSFPLHPWLYLHLLLLLGAGSLLATLSESGPQAPLMKVSLCFL